MKKERRSLYELIFGKKNKNVSMTSLNMMNGSSYFGTFGDNLYKSKIFREALNTLAQNGAKLKIKHDFLKNKNSRVTSDLNYLLQYMPNQYMNAYDFLYKVLASYYEHNNSFIYIDTDGKGKIIAFYPLDYSMTELLEQNNRIYVRFSFMSGDRFVVPYDKIIHLRRYFNHNDLYGDDNSPLFDTMERVKIVNDGINNAIKTSANIRGIYESTGILKDSDLEKIRENFKNAFLNPKNSGGIITTDSKGKFIPTDNKPVVIDNDTMTSIKEEVYDYFNVNANLVKSKYTEDEFNAYYESVLEPFIIQASLEFTNKCFSKQEIACGNRIIFEANRLAYASYKTKVSIIQTLMPLGLLTQNQALEILNLPSFDEGDKRIISLNYVDAKKQNVYQGVEGDDKDEQEENE